MDTHTHHQPIALTGLRTAACLALAAGMTPAAHAQTNRFISNGGQWNEPANWSLGVVPDSGHHVLIDPLGPNSGTVLYAPTAGPQFRDVTVQSGMTLDLAGRYLQPDTLHNYGTTIVRPANLGGSTIGMSGDFVNHGLFRVMDDGWAQFTGANEAVNNFGTLAGVGGLSFNSGPASRNVGTIRADGNGELAVAAYALFAPNVFDLDGDGAGRVEITTAQSSFRLGALGLADPFGGVIEIKSGGVLHMQLLDPWAMDAAGRVVVLPGNGPGQVARIEGSPWTVGGLVELHDGPTRLDIAADATISASATVDVGTDAWLSFVGDATVNGGLFSVGQDARVDFSGPVTLSGGYFETPSAGVADGLVSFLGPTHLAGEVTIDGVGRQEGNVTVGPNPGAIFARTFDMDGLFGANTWTINAGLRIEADRVETDASNRVDSDISVGGGFVSQLTVALTDPAQAWTSAGVLNLTGSAAAGFPLNRLGGSPVVIAGGLGVSHRVRVTADLRLNPTAVVDFASPSALIQTTGRTEILPGAGFQGGGTISNGTEGHMSLHDGAVVSGARLQNAGRLDFGPGPGLVAVDAFENTTSGDWRVRIGGYAPGSEHDLMTVSAGQAVLAGKLSVELADTGAGLFVPRIGDEFTILTAVDGVTGAFVNTPTAVADGLAYTWSVVYQPNAVVLRLEGVGPASCDADVDGNGLVNFFDLAAFMALYNAQDPAADLAPAFGTFSFFDVAEYLAIYTTGCP